MLKLVLQSTHCTCTHVRRVNDTRQATDARRRQREDPYDASSPPAARPRAALLDDAEFDLDAGGGVAVKHVFSDDWFLG